MDRICEKEKKEVERVMRAAIYCRLSEEDKYKQAEWVESESIQNQKSMLIHYAKEQGWEVYKVYSDDDYTGSDRKRPEFNRLLEDARAHRFDVVLCKTQSRFTRELELVEKYIHGLFPILGIRFVSIVDNADTDNRGNKKSRQINGLVNEWYLEDMSESIKSVLDNKRRLGLHIGSFAAYGYEKDQNVKGHLIIDQEAAEVVREIFSLYADGYGKTAIARMLNAQKIPSPALYRKRKNPAYQSTSGKRESLWSASAIGRILENEMYTGTMVQGRYGSVSYKTKQNKPKSIQEWFRVEGTHEPIIEKELWNQVQTLRLEKNRPLVSRKRGIFAGKVRCAACGYTMCSTKSRGKSYLRCPLHNIDPNSCKGAFISVETLSCGIAAELNCLGRDYVQKEYIVEQAILEEKQENRKKKPIHLEIAGCQKKIRECEKALYDLYLDKSKGILGEEKFILLSDSVCSEREQLQQSLSALEADARLSNTKLLEKEADTERERKEIMELLEPEKMDIDLIALMIEYISVGKRKTGTSQVPVEIHWKF